jgi:hypothetical protein
MTDLKVTIGPKLMIVLVIFIAALVITTLVALDAQEVALSLIDRMFGSADTFLGGENEIQ